MNANSTDKKTFQLTENGQQLGEIIYENLFFLKAEIHLGNAEKYKVAPVGFFGTSISVTQSETQIATLSLSWNGKIVISFQDGQEFSLKLNDIFSNKYILEDKNKETILQINSKFNWRQFQYTYDIAYDVKYQKKPKDVLLAILCIYSANYFIATMSGVNAGIM